MNEYLVRVEFSWEQEETDVRDEMEIDVVAPSKDKARRRARKMVDQMHPVNTIHNAEIIYSNGFDS